MPAPSSASRRARINPAECSISRRHCASRAVTRSVVPSSATVVARATDEPTAVRQAKATFSGESGAFLRTAASASGMNLCTGIIDAPIMTLLLASASPRRAALLRAAGFSFDVQPADVDESLHPGEQAEQYVRRVAEAKARAVLPQAGARIVLAADTTVVIDGQVLAKPVDDEDAARMLRLLSGRRHDVLTAVTLARGGDDLHTRVAHTGVQFAALTDEDIAWYVASGEPLDKAGAYALQGLASRYVTRVDGSPSNVVGLPVALVHVMLTQLDAHA
jgi:septum formation protein